MRRVIELLREYYMYVILVVLLVWGIVFFTLWNKHECPTLNTPELTKEHIEKIKTISDAQDNHTIDSLFFELYGFEPAR